MRNRKTRIIIGILVGLIFFSSSIALLMYTKQNDLRQYVEDHVEVYVSAKHFNRGDIITAGDIEKAYLPKSYLSFRPLTKSEIIGRYAVVSIFPKEPLRSEKISMTQPSMEKVAIKKVAIKKVEKKKEKTVKKDTITVSLSVFNNIDPTLKRGDHIDILSVVPKRVSKSNNYNTKYLALRVRINTFISNTKQVKKYISSNQNGKSIAADSIVLEMEPKEIKNFLSIYYRTLELNENRVFNGQKKGHLWMVKCSNVQNSLDIKSKEKMLVDRKRAVVKRRKSQRKVSISYED